MSVQMDILCTKDLNQCIWIKPVFIFTSLSVKANAAIAAFTPLPALIGFLNL